MLQLFTPLSLLTLFTLLQLSAALFLFDESKAEKRVWKRSTAKCPEGWYLDEVGKMCYKTFKTPLNRKCASVVCGEAVKGATLAVASNNSTSDGFMRYVRNYKALVNDSCLFAPTIASFLTGELRGNCPGQLPTGITKESTTTTTTTTAASETTTTFQASEATHSEVNTTKVVTSATTNDDDGDDDDDDDDDDVSDGTGTEVSNTEAVTDPTSNDQQNSSTPCVPTDNFCVSFYLFGNLQESGEYEWELTFPLAFPCVLEQCFICQVEPQEA